MSVLVSRINLLFASGIGEKTQLCRNMKPAVPSPGNRDKSWSSGKRSTDLGESTQGSARGSFFFFFLHTWMFSKGAATHSRCALCEDGTVDTRTSSLPSHGL